MIEPHPDLSSGWEQAPSEGLKVGVLQLGAGEQGLEHLLLENQALRTRQFDDAGNLGISQASTNSLFSGDAAMLCMGGQGASPLGGMVPMYLLMSAFHLAPWLRLRRQGSVRRR